MSRWNPRPPWARKTHNQRPRPSHESAATGVGGELVAVARTMAMRHLEGDRLAHTIGVVVEADWLAQALLTDVDRQTVLAAAWIHDIGRAPDLNDTGFHPVDGARFARSLGFPSQIVSLIAHHTGATIEAQELGMQAELETFAPPDPRLLEVLSTADLSAGPDGAHIDPHVRLVEVLQRYPSDHSTHRAVARSSGPLLEIADRLLAEVLITKAPYVVAIETGPLAQRIKRMAVTLGWRLENEIEERISFVHNGFHINVRWGKDGESAFYVLLARNGHPYGTIIDEALGPHESPALTEQLEQWLREYGDNAAGATDLAGAS
ncbi:HD domain-containing protein [Mycobacteroides abscessus]|uniref:HD domain-containing protein n=1 Tax=Mycobacteroides abscessus TaxID=36809 RepID=UPI0009A768E6|nr:HD domain-containing protein [Mycobacteroides abscessus]SKU61280.1 metal dependent phosphohydrolase [Mycobacteroides abscessus subsp. massiliense]